MISCKFDFGQVNANQREAIEAADGPVLIIAGPGTGKTFTLVKRIAYLVIEKQVSPESIMVVTFTEKAGKELITRISNEFLKYDQSININDMYIGTFHSVCLRLLKEYSEYREDSIEPRLLDAFEQTYMVCRNIEKFQSLSEYRQHITGSDPWQQSLEICRYVNQLMEELVDLDAMTKDADKDMRFLAGLVRRYQALLDQNQAMDFSTIQIRAYQMMKKYPKVLHQIQSKIRYIMVDEYQDTNFIQEQLVFLMADDCQNICVVGDDDQGMYRFRGATIRNILEFPLQFKNKECRIIHLNTNYRSEPGIIDFYNRWMEDVDGINLFNWDKYRYPKKIEAGKSLRSEEPSVFFCGGDSLDEQKNAIYNMLVQLREQHNISDYNQVAFLFRSVKSREAKEIGEYLEAKGIPIYSPRSDLFFERPETMQILGSLMLCFNTYMQDLKKNHFNYPISKKLREYYIGCLRSVAALKKENQQFSEYMDSVSKTISSAKENTEITLLDLFYRIVGFEPFKSCLEADLRGNINHTRAARNLSEVSRMLSKYSFLHHMHQITGENKINLPEELFNVYLRYMYEDGIGEYEDESEYAPRGCVSFMTIHQSKGLEFPVVVVGSLGNTPRKNSDPLLYSAESRFFHRPPYEPMGDIRYFDFWRLYYTAFSRAQNLLVLTAHERDSKYFGEQISELPPIDTYQSVRVLETVKDVNYKHVYSFTSHISVYDGCPKQYKFYKEYGFAQNQMFHTSVGSLVHATLEDMNKCVIAGNRERVNEDAIKGWFSVNYQSMHEQTGYELTEEQRENALQQVIRYYRHRQQELRSVWRAEEEINLVLPDYILQGIIDLIEGDDDTVEIVDYKTGIKPDMNKHPERVEHYRKQLEIYAYLIEQKFGKKVSRMHLYYTSTLEGDPLISFEWSRKAVDQAIAEVSETIRKIERSDFRGDVTNNYACRFCDMRYVCGKQ